MLRKAVCAALALFVFAGFSLGGDEAKKKKKKKAAVAASVSGEILKIDAEKGLLTIKVPVKKKQTEDKEFKVTDKTAVTAKDGEDKVEVKADKVADLLKKDEYFKVGANVTIEAESDGTAKRISFGAASTTKKKKKKADK